jgi:exopolyphosphatase/guanosine-5'-triphosphate,3'-diphosphate pyrophosphatase
VPRALTRSGAADALDLVSGLPVRERATLPGVSPRRAGQLVAGALVGYEALTAFDVDAVDICPWALREGVVLRRLDWLAEA